ncbi:hypothetical protein, partial [Mesorhizobium sp. M7A.F.Ca.CA.004.12.1.1]|uniref:hypothetical protein n=1 Tax=Mesorhizobium sp. M7A.F.Ca.CA.004.12.1.1 TaxID=2496732 RepID=UPI0019D0F9F4
MISASLRSDASVAAMVAAALQAGMTTLIALNYKTSRHALEDTTTVTPKRIQTSGRIGILEAVLS